MRAVDADTLTVGVEEEFLLLDQDGKVCPVAADVVRIADRFGRVKPEFMAFQVETATGVCRSLDELRSELARLRAHTSRSAEVEGVALVACGMPPYSVPPYPVGSATCQPDEGRYDELRRRFPQAVPSLAGCACHVHVGICHRDLAVKVLARMRPWLATLLALFGNSPIVDGLDTNWSSRRYLAQLRWPTFRPPEDWQDADTYDRSLRSLIARGAAADLRSVYLLARLSPRYSTLEVRVADTCLAVDDAVLLAAIVRALVETLVEDIRENNTIAPVSRSLLHSSLLSAAHDGMAMVVGTGTSDYSLAHLREKISLRLDRANEAEYVLHGLDRLRRQGNGADRQRTLWARAADSADFVSSLAHITRSVDDLTIDVRHGVDS